MMTNETTAKAYELRNLTADDVFPMFRIISKIGIREFKSCFESEAVSTAIANATAGKGADLNAVGVVIAIDVAAVIMSKLPDCKEEIYGFLASLSGMNKEDIAALPMVTFASMIIDVIKKEEFKDFFQVVTGLLK